MGMSWTGTWFPICIWQSDTHHCVTDNDLMRGVAAGGGAWGRGDGDRGE